MIFSLKTSKILTVIKFANKDTLYNLITLLVFINLQITYLYTRLLAEYNNQYFNTSIKLPLVMLKKYILKNKLPNILIISFKLFSTTNLIQFLFVQFPSIY